MTKKSTALSMNSFVASTAFSIFSLSLSITFNMRILNHRLTRKSTLYFIFFFFFLSDNETQSQRGGAPAERGYVNYFLFALPTHEIFKVVPFGSFIVVDVVLLAASATSAGNQFSVSIEVGLKNLFASNVHISHNWKQYSTVSENCNTLFHFFYFFLAHDLAHNMLCLGGPARGRVCQLLFIVYKKRADRLP